MKVYKLDKQSVKDYIDISEQVLTVCISECNLDCVNCSVAWLGNGNFFSVDKLLENIREKFIEEKLPDVVLISGGEPLIFSEIIILSNALISMGKKVIIKTNGSMTLENLPKEIIKVVSYKLPSSNEDDSFYLENILYLNRHDYLRFKIYTDEDFIYALKFLKNIDFSILFFKIQFIIHNKSVPIDDIFNKINNEFDTNNIIKPEYLIKIISP